MVENNVERLQFYFTGVVADHVEIFKHKNENHSVSFIDLNKALDYPKTNGFYYLLIYSFYEIGLIGIPRCMADVEKIFVNIITYTRLMAYMHNDKVKGEIMLEDNPTIIGSCISYAL